MFLRKVLLTLVLLLTMISGQSLINGYGFLRNSTALDAASMGIASSGLLPGFQQGVSLNNPATWHLLNFTYFSGNYGGRKIEFQDEKIINGSTGLDQVKLVIPIKNKYSFGFSVYPFSDQQLALEGQEISWDTLSIRPYIISEGGISSLNTSIGYGINKSDHVAVEFDFLFGSSRYKSILEIENKKYIYPKRNSYSGVLAKIYYVTDRFSVKGKKFTSLFSFGFPLKSLKISTFTYTPFEDNNDNESHDLNSYDFPNLSIVPDPQKGKIKDNLAPIEIEAGFDYKMSPLFHFQGAISLYNDLAESNPDLFLLHDKIGKVFETSTSLITFAKKNPRNWIDRSQVRLGLYTRGMQLDKTGVNIIENGISLGIGFIFGNTNSQIDFAYSLGDRYGYPGSRKEIVQKFSVGLNIGDIWFIKRRAR